VHFRAPMGRMQLPPVGRLRLIEHLKRREQSYYHRRVSVLICATSLAHQKFILII
jgi:hypothetical protein